MLLPRKFKQLRVGGDRPIEAAIAASAKGVDALSGECQFGGVKSNSAKKLAADLAGEPTIGSKMVEKYRSRMSRLTDAERQKLAERGLQITRA